jgi:isopropylmalate/homocitrate/citramalate synthase
MSRRAPDSLRLSDDADDDDRPLWMVGPVGQDVLESDAFAETVRIVDGTLQDGEQQAGVAFTAAEKLAIARQLDALGVAEIAAGSPDDRDALAALAYAGLTAKISAQAGARPADIDLVAASGIRIVRLGLPISPIRRQGMAGLDDAAYLRCALDATGYAKERGLQVVFSPEDAARCDLGFLRQVVSALGERGTVDRFRLDDTVGCATPDGMKLLVREVRKATAVPIEIHCRNDFGLAVASTIAGAQGGAEYLSVTMNGIGERSGNASLEETVVALLVLYGMDLGIDTTRLTALSRLVEEVSRVRMPRHKAIVGREAFTHESGAAVAGLVRQSFAAEAYAPHLVGQVRQIVLGKNSGVGSVELKLAQLGFSANEGQRDELLRRIREEAIRTKALIADARFIDMANDALSVG